MKKRKLVTMTVTVSCPKWLTAAQARKEVKTLIKYQEFWGHTNSVGYNYDEISGHNFKARRVGPVAK